MIDPNLFADTWFLLTPEQRFVLERRAEQGEPFWAGVLPWVPESASSAAATAMAEIDCGP